MVERGLFGTGPVDLAFLRSTKVLVSGAVVGQAIALAFYPVLTRLFSPDMFGRYALLNSFASIAAVGSSLRYDVAIISAETQVEARALLSASVLFSVLVAIASGLLFTEFIHAGRMGLSVLPPLAGVLAFLTVAVLGVHSAIRCWNVRQRHFEQLSRVSVRQSLSRVAVWCLGVFHPQWYLLTIADLASRTYGIAYMIRHSPAPIPWRYSPGLVRDVRLAIAKYWSFPVLLLPSSLVDTLTVMLPVPMFATLYGASAAGQFALSYQLLSVPSVFLNASVAESFHSHLTEYAASGRRAQRLFWHTCAGLIAIGVLPFAMIFLAGNRILPMLLGSAWSEAGLLAAAMAPWLFALFVLNPIERVVMVFNGKNVKLLYNVTTLALTFGLIYYAGHNGFTLLQCVTLLSTMSFLMLMVYFVLLERLVRRASVNS